MNGGDDPRAFALVVEYRVGEHGSGVVTIASERGSQRKMGEGPIEGQVHTWQPPANPQPTGRARIVPKARSGHGEGKKR